MRGTASGGVLFSGEKYPKAAMGQQARRALLGPNAPVSPDPFRSTSGGGSVQEAAVFESSYYAGSAGQCRDCIARAGSTPRLVNRCNSITVLNAARSLCAVLQPPVEATKPSPWGEGAPVRTLGRMRGRPVDLPQSPSSVTLCVTASPEREAKGEHHVKAFALGKGLLPERPAQTPSLWLISTGRSGVMVEIACL